MSDITIIDYGYGNIFSLISALKVLGYSSEVSNDPEKIKKSKLLVLPGVGAFRVAMDSLVKLKLDIAIKDCLQRGGKIIGICLGYQMLFNESEEFGYTKGLGLIKGKVIKVNNNNPCYKVPNVGWRNITLNENCKNNFNFESNKMVYFVHSYIPISEDEKKVLFYINYNNQLLHASVLYGQIIGFQFHPEKSGPIGLNILDKTIRGLI